MSREHFIKNIEIKNFKCFKDFRAEGFGRVNLIGGKNNVGKTAFMEAVYVNVHAKDINYIIYALYAIEHTRNYIEYIDNNEPKIYKILNKIKNYEVKSNLRDTNFHIEIKNSKKKYYILGSKLDKNDFSQDFEDYDYIENISFIDNVGFTNYELELSYKAVQLKDKEELLNKYINIFDENIEKFKIIQNQAKCKVKNGDYKDINDFGDGLKEYISIISSLYACENGYLFIDEVGNGIHYTNLDKLWEIILKISKEQNVQVFATTHSKECIESYARVAKKLEDKEIAFIELCKREEEIKAFIYPYDWFIDEIEQEHEVRGCL